MHTYEQVSKMIERFASTCMTRRLKIAVGDCSPDPASSSASSAGVTDECSFGLLRPYQAHRAMTITAGNAGQKSAFCQPTEFIRMATIGGVAAAANCMPMVCTP